jgi:large subunit ribosomal protein L5
MTRLKNHYNNTIIYDLITKFNYKNYFMIPTLKKISLNIGIKEIIINKKLILANIIFLELLTNQKHITTKSTKDKLKFKIRKGSIVGCKVTLRGNSIYNFIEKCLIFIFPNIKLFYGINLSVKSPNSVSFKIYNSLDFLEINDSFQKFQSISTLDITAYITTKNVYELETFLNCFNLPIKRVS